MQAAQEKLLEEAAELFGVTGADEYRLWEGGDFDTARIYGYTQTVSRSK